MEKLAYNWTRFWIGLSSLGILVMVVLKLAESWSQNHATANEPWLNATLIGIVATFTIRSMAHPLAGKGLFILNLFRIKWVRNRHLCAATAILFAGVLIFGVNSPTSWVQTAHLIFTGLAIASVYLNLLFYPETKVGRFLAVLGAVVGIGGFISAFWWDHTIAEGEMIAAVPVIAWVLLTTKLKK
ncbi:hypothetical protein [Robiginitalea biformata]|uniref:Uncharacterized protein n=1 Tax=Robiginitalea biformata (strain ATCC BAA-864 / DSM 15991 / KCTC 12146 / HTCC2501) TaxID=313596 RepID=A4CP48_ROBBH|nr:hypothetical protein [Robiginitalea biformata]EAR14665.1 hypothetical protein RB2501_01276 [Robiginitalea biformata HTCC2501]